MPKHRKDKKITILEYVEERNEDNIPIEKYVPVKNSENIWAYYRHLSGKEFYSAHAVNSKVEVIFEINWRKGIDTRMKVLYNNEEYYISQIDDFEGKKTDLKLYAYKIN